MDEIASTVVHEGRHLLDHGKMMKAIEKAFPNQPEVVKFIGEARAHFQQLMFDLERGIDSAVFKAFTFGVNGQKGWAGVIQHILKEYTDVKRPGT